MAIKNRYIKVSFQREGVHKFPGADTNPEYGILVFLSYPFTINFLILGKFRFFSSHIMYIKFDKEKCEYL